MLFLLLSFTLSQLWYIFDHTDYGSFTDFLDQILNSSSPFTRIPPFFKFVECADFMVALSLCSIKHTKSFEDIKKLDKKNWIPQVLIFNFCDVFLILDVLLDFISYFPSFKCGDD